MIHGGAKNGVGSRGCRKNPGHSLGAQNLRKGERKASIQEEG